jgi:hypothetical protein
MAVLLYKVINLLLEEEGSKGYGDLQLRDRIEVFALIAGPTFAVWLTLYAQKRAQIRNQRIGVFQTLLAYRQDVLNAERVKALCLIDIVFHDVPSVRSKWKEYFDALSDQGVRIIQKSYIY